MVEVYGKKARQINAQDPVHRRAYTWINTQCKERRKEVEEKKGRKKTSSPREGFRTHNPHLRKQGSSLYSNIYTAQRSLASVALYITLGRAVSRNVYRGFIVGNRFLHSLLEDFLC